MADPALNQPARAADGLWFGKDPSQPAPIPEAGIARAVELMRSGRLHRYGETGGTEPEPSLLEQEYAAYIGSKYCVAMSSRGATMFVALKSLGHIADMRAVRSICDARGIALVEDCAHTMGARWAGRASDAWGRISCYSTQTYKHINSGEGGLLVTDDDDVAARAILHSSSYMLYGQHLSKPPAEVFERWRYYTPNFSLRMSNHAAAMLRPRWADMPRRAAVWNALYARLARAFADLPGLSVPARDAKEEFVASSIQFTLDLPPERIERFLAGCDSRGLHIKWFGRTEPRGFTSNYTHWHYLRQKQQVPASLPLMEGLCDMRIPLSLTGDDCVLIGRIVRAALAEA